MLENDVRDILALHKGMYAPLTELIDLTEQIAQSLDRDDQTSVRMLIAMRNDPIYKLAEADDRIRARLAELEQADGLHLRGILQGQPGQNALEQQLSEQAAANRRTMQKLRALDERVSRRMAGEKSLYAQMEKDQ